ncbi:hypothetical protein IFM89_009569 [Coptis chinensis]|uniref:Protein FAR1-RELATED SEQUENCE n=1 Tax=Coptis chinensis TaxID=261450 RepID=A0A835INI5_9MAGN|nr:hypothetical protein IFM89_009569 [Coptis chinensis]
MVANQLVYEAAEANETYPSMLKRLQALSLELKEIKKTNDRSKISVIDSCTVNENSQSAIDASQVLLMNPNISQTKGRKKEEKVYKSSTIIKGGLEKGIAKATKVKIGRRCTSCNQVGVNHEKHNCPKNPNRKKGIIIDEEIEDVDDHRDDDDDDEDRDSDEDNEDRDGKEVEFKF